jgi:Domain of unknown function (DUF6089)
MKKVILILLVTIIPLITNAQYNWDFGVHAGAANYLGDIGGGAGTRKDFVADMKLSKTQITAGAFARYKVNQYISAKGGFNWVRITGADNKSTNPARVGRNLSFQNDILELELVGQVFFFEIPDLGHTYKYRNDFRMYVFGGVSAFHHNPKTYYKGEWVALQPLQTEGVKYSKFSTAIPLGLGFYFTIDKKHRIGWEFNWRTTFTDYLDDVSGLYVSEEDLGNDPTRIALANRRGEISASETNVAAARNYEPGMKRGDQTHKDSFLSTSLYYSYSLKGKSNFYKSKYGSIFKKTKYKKRKTKAKF